MLRGGYSAGNRKGALEMTRFKWLIAGCISILFVVTFLSGCFLVGSDSEIVPSQDSTTNEVSPPQDFPDYGTLAGWIENHVPPFEIGSGAVAWYNAALVIQREAANDGYLVSAVITGNPDAPDEYIVWCTALATGDLYWWHPEDSECTLMFTAEELAK